jgi:hypothetical protein
MLSLQGRTSTPLSPASGGAAVATGTTVGIAMAVHSVARAAYDAQQFREQLIRQYLRR